MDSPYYVERTHVAGGYGATLDAFWSVRRVGEGEVCRSADVTYAYRVTDLLNEDLTRMTLRRIATSVQGP